MTKTVEHNFGEGKENKTQWLLNLQIKSFGEGK